MKRTRRDSSLTRPDHALDRDRYSPLRIMFSCMLALSFAVSASAESDAARTDSDTRRPAVAAANARVEAHYSYQHIDRTRTVFNSSPTTTTILRIGEADFQNVMGRVGGTIPVMHSLGLRGDIHGSYHMARRNLDVFGPGNDDSESSSYGATAEIFLRDPDLGSVTAGASYDRRDGDGGVDSNEFGARASAAVFFPDLGSGPVDWNVHFNYTRQDISSSGASSDLDADIFAVAGSAGWYLTDHSQLVVGARWTRAADDFISEEDIEGFMDVRWLLPTPISMELSLGGSAGVSEYKERPFAADDRLIYGAHMGLIFRFRSAPTLIDIVRAYD